MRPPMRPSLAPLVVCLLLGGCRRFYDPPVPILTLVPTGMLATGPSAKADEQTMCLIAGASLQAPVYAHEPTVAGPFREWRYVRCAGCAHCRLIPTPGEDYLGAYYNSAYRVPPERYFAAARREVPLVRRMLARRHSSRGCLLEVGASYGAMLAALRDDGWDVIGTELDRRAAEQAHARYGIDVRFEALAVVPDKGPLDAVVLFHVIEHLPEPEAFLVAVRAQLKRGGTLLLKTPNGGSWLAEHVQGWWEWF